MGVDYHMAMVTSASGFCFEGHPYMPDTEGVKFQLFLWGRAYFTMQVAFSDFKLE